MISQKIKALQMLTIAMISQIDLKRYQITNINSISSDANSVLPNFTYNYQLDGNIVDAEDSYRNVVLSYNYDDLSRLINESRVNNDSIPTQQPTNTGDIVILMVTS